MKLTLSKEYLTTPCQQFDFNNPPLDIEDLSLSMIEFIKENGGAGLALNQVGFPYKVIAILGEPSFVMFNPRLVFEGNHLVLLDEGCLSYPGLVVPVKRSNHIKVRFQAPDGESYTKEFTGLTARVVLQELETLEGKIFYNSANRYYREKALRKWRD